MTKELRSKGFFGYDPVLEEEVFELLHAEYPDRDPEQVPSNWRWMFFDSAKRLGLAPQVWLYRRKGTVVAHQGAIPVKLHVTGEERPTGWFVETIAAESVRGTPIGPMLIRKALEDMPLNLSLGQTEQMRQLQFAMGWKHVCTLTKRVFVSGYRMNLRNKLPMIAAELAAIWLGVRHQWFWRKMSRKYGAAFRCELIERFTDEHDELWRRMSDTCQCAVVRDSSYMNWKYVDRPSRSFTCIELREGDKLAGVVVVMTADANDVYPYRRGYLVDFVVPLDCPDVIAALVTQGVGQLKRQGAQMVVCQVANSQLCSVLDGFGFMARQPRHQFLVAPGPDVGPIAGRLLDADSWFITLGDSDADSYAD